MTNDIYQFEDYRDYLQLLFSIKQKECGKYSQRDFARDAGISNPGYFNDVLQKRRKLSVDACEKYILVFKMSANDAEYFRLLVEFDQEKDSTKREELYRRLLFRRSRSTFVRLNPAKSRYYEDYRYPLIRAAIEVLNFKGDYNQLGHFMSPPLQPAKVQAMVKDLLDWGIIKKTSSGRFVVSDRFVEPAPGMTEQIRNLNRNWIKQSAEAIDRFLPEQRHISTILLTVSESTAQTIQKKIEQFRQEVFELIQNDDNPERIMQLSLQYFPKSGVNKNV
jgi:uncharacterized protein (TIGR02147 family)